MVVEIIAGAIFLAGMFLGGASIRSLSKEKEDLLRRVVALENALDLVEKSCTISSESITHLDQNVTGKLDKMNAKIVDARSDALRSVSQVDHLARDLREIRLALARHDFSQATQVPLHLKKRIAERQKGEEQ